LYVFESDYFSHLIADAASATPNISPPSDTVSKVAFAIGSAIIGAACSYVIALLLARRNPHKQLSWDASTDRSMLSVSSDIRDNVNISYKGENVSDLVAVKCRVANTGNTVIKEEQLRFAFRDGTRILEADFSPQPERELRAARVDLADLKPTERMFFIGQLEAGQEVSFEIMATGERVEEWSLHHSDEGNVEFRQRDANRIKDEEEHIRPTVIIAILFLAISAIMQAIEATDFFLNQFVAGIGVLIDLALAISLAPHVLPIARIIQRLVARWLLRPDATTSVTIQGGDARVVASSGTVGTVRFGRDAD
jgi:hypothetical protein